MQNTNKGKCGLEKPWSIRVSLCGGRRDNACDEANTAIRLNSYNHTGKNCPFRQPAQSISRVSNNSHQQQLLPQQQQPAGLGNRFCVFSARCERLPPSEGSMQCDTLNTKAESSYETIVYQSTRRHITSGPLQASGCYVSLAVTLTK